MDAMQHDPRKPKGKPDVPSTGRGAASAMDALIRKRMPAPAASGDPQPQQQQHTHSKKR